MRCKVIFAVDEEMIDIEVKKGVFVFRKRISRLHEAPLKTKRKRKGGTRRTLKSWIRILRDMRGIVGFRKVVVMEKEMFPPGFYALYYALVFWWSPGIVIRRVPDMTRDLVIESDVDVNIRKGGVFLWKRRQMF
jgi:hypothetical protein